MKILSCKSIILSVAALLLSGLLFSGCGGDKENGYAMLKVAIWDKPVPKSDKSRKWVATLNRGEQFKLVKTGPDKKWIKIKLSDGKAGWLEKRFVFLGERKIVQFGSATPWFSRPDAMSPKKSKPIPAGTTAFILEERDGGWMKVNIKSTWMNGWVRKGAAQSVDTPAAGSDNAADINNSSKNFSINIAGIGTCTVTASGWLTDSEGYQYSPKNMFDSKMETSWQEAASGSGIGQWIKIKLPQKMTVLVEMVNGFSFNHDKYGDLYKKNSRATGIEVSYGDNLSQSRNVNLSGSERGFQSLGAFTTDTLRLKITAAEKGSKWDDTSISELRLRKLN